MDEPVDIETAELGHTFADSELKDQCKVIMGGIAWPGKEAGYGVILALGINEHWQGGRIYLLDEVKSFDLGELILKCEALDLKYKPKYWSGDDKNAAAGQFMLDIQSKSRFWVSHSSVIDMDQPYPYMMATIKDLLRDDSGDDNHRLNLKASVIFDHLGTIKKDVVSLQLGDHPAIEALAFAVCELKDDALWWPKPLPRYEKPASAYPMGF